MYTSCLTKQRLLIYTDSPLAATGFGQVSKHILASLYASGKYEIELIGINHIFDWYNMDLYPYKIHASLYGNKGAQKIAKGLVEKGDYDILLVICDTQWAFDLSEHSRRLHPEKRIVISTLYDTDSIFRADERRNGLYEGLLLGDISIVPTKRLYTQIVSAMPQLKSKLRWIHYGIDQEEIYPLGDQAIRDFRETVGLHDEFIVLNVNRNQFRKDLPRTMMAFKIFNDKHSDSKLEIHAKREAEGGDLYNQAYEVGLNIKNLILPTEDFEEMVGYSRAQLNMIYNISDCVVSTTLGEGWGFSSVEGMAAKRPIVMPRNTALIEIIGESEKRGYFAQCGTTSSEWYLPPGINNLIRPLTNIDSMVEQLEYLYQHRSGIGHYDDIRTKMKIKHAYNWCGKNSWEIICNKYLDVFAELEQPKLYVKKDTD